MEIRPIIGLSESKKRRGARAEGGDGGDDIREIERAKPGGVVVQAIELGFGGIGMGGWEGQRSIVFTYLGLGLGWTASRWWWGSEPIYSGPTPA